jgi:hypothetical protein
MIIWFGPWPHCVSKLYSHINFGKNDRKNHRGSIEIVANFEIA